MAEIQLFVSQDDFTCSVCLNTLTDPVTIPCGHNFCLNCLMDCWEQSKECSCPQCRHTFTTRPALRRNTLLSEVVKKLKKSRLSSPPSQNYASPGDVECDFCTGKKFRAVKSCLTCMASYCQTHLQLHYEGDALKHHNLVDPDGNVKGKLFWKHHKSLEMFCKSDETCISMMCGMTEQNNHEKVELETETEGKQKQLKATLREIRRRLEEKEKKLRETRRTVEEMKLSVERVMGEHEKSFTDLIHCIEETYKNLTERIREQEKGEMEKAEGVMEQLEKEIEELKRSEAELKELSEIKDHLQFLQSFSSHCVLPADGDSLSFTVTADFSSEDLLKELSGLKKSLEKISKWDIPTWTPPATFWINWRLYNEQFEHPVNHVINVTMEETSLILLGGNFHFKTNISDISLCKMEVVYIHSSGRRNYWNCADCEAPTFTPWPPEPQSRDEFLQYFCPLTLDINTANRDLLLSEGNKKVTRERKKFEYPDHPDRFDCYFQVLCREALTGTRCYWEVECRGCFMKIGVAYKGLGRKGDGWECGLGYNDKSWSLVWSLSQYSVCHNKKEIIISAPYSPRIGVYLDWPDGSLSFYSVSHTMTLLHRINTSFTEPLYPGFGFGLHSSVTISHLTSCDH